eukprot:6487526-Amphidinium_carterae.1
MSSSFIESVAVLSSELLTERALIRRGYALQMSDLMSHSTHQKIVDKYVDDVCRDATDGFAKITWSQIQKADAVLWNKLADASQGSLGRSEDGRRPLDSLVDRFLHDPSVVYHLIPRMMSRDAGTSSVSGSRRVGGGGVGASGVKRELQHAAASGKPPAKKAKGKSKSGNSGFDRGLPLPGLLRGLNSRTADGSRICYNFNLGSCKENPCPNGYAHSLDLYSSAVKLPVFLEIFAGSGRLARHFKTQGFEVVAIDAGRSSKLVEAPITYLDLASPAHQKRVLDIVHGAAISFVHIRPPSATASRARARMLPGGGSSPLLRSDVFPDGLPGLSPPDAER